MSIRSKVTSSKSRARRSHHKVSEPALTTDEKGNVHLRHRVSPTTGMYKGRQVLDVEKKIVKNAEKKKAKAVEQGKEVKEEKVDSQE